MAPAKKPTKSPKRTAATQAPMKKAVAKKAPARKVPAKKAAAKKAAPEAEPRYGRREDYGSDVDTLVAKLPPSAREMVNALRNIVREAAPEATESVKWGMPVYAQNGLFCYISSKGKQIRFGFYEQGIRLTDPDGLLEGTGENMRHVKIGAPQDIRPELFTRWVKEAVRLNVSR